MARREDGVDMGTWRRVVPGPEHVIDVFVYVVVLNLTAQYAPEVITETFTTSLLVAVLLKLVLEVVLAAKRRAKRRFTAAQTLLGKAGGLLMLAVLLPGSKLVVLELVAFVFGDAVSLGGFVTVTALIIALLLARLGVRRLLGLQRDGAEPTTPQTTVTVS
ncbi:hypothetical protein [Cellulomonas soli]